MLASTAHINSHSFICEAFTIPAYSQNLNGSGLHGELQLAAAAPWTELADHLLLDARPPRGAAMTGGLGVAFDWTLTQGFRPPRPWFLAGGLDPWNIAEALEVSGAPMADVSSGVERGPGLKDPSLISAFLDAVRRARPQA